MELFAVFENLPADVPAVRAAEQAHGELRASRTHEAGDADDLAAPHMEVHVIHHELPGDIRRPDRPVLHLEARIADCRTRQALRIAVRDLSADHARDDAVFRDIIHAFRQRLDRPAIADDGDAVRDFRDLVELVRNDDRRDLQIFPQLEDEVQQLFAVLIVERCRRLVEDEQPHVLRKRFRDLDELLLADAELVDRDARRNIEADALHEVDGFLVALFPIHEPVALAFVAEEHVLHDREIRHERELLMDDDDAFFFAVTNRLELARLAVINDVALIRPVRVNARQHVHERRLAGAVLAAERMDRAFLHLEVDMVERAHAAREFLDDVLHFQKVLCHTCTFFRIPQSGAG